MPWRMFVLLQTALQMTAIVQVVSKEIPFQPRMVADASFQTNLKI